MNLYLLNGVLGVNDYDCEGMPDSKGAVCVMKQLPTESEKSSLPSCENGWVMAEGTQLSKLIINLFWCNTSFQANATKLSLVC